MLMFIKIFLVSCIMAQAQFNAQPLSKDVEYSIGSAAVDNNSTIFSLINGAGNCAAYEHLKSEPNFRKLEGYCERPSPDTPSVDTYISYEVILCMALYDAVQHVCSVGQKEVAKGTQSFNSSFSCDTMNKEVPKAFDGRTEPWVALFKTKFGNISDCEKQCMQDKMINPICEYIWKANTLTHQAQLSSATSMVVSSTENPPVNSKGHGKTNKKTISKDKPLDGNTSDLSSAAHTPHPIMNNGSRNTEQFDHEMKPNNKPAFDKEVIWDSTHSGSENDVNNNVNQQAHTADSNVQLDSKNQLQAKNNIAHNDSKKLPHRAGSNTQNDINAHGTNSNLQNITKKQEHATNSNNGSAEVTPPDAAVSLSANTERTQGAKSDDSTGKILPSDSRSNTAPEPEKSSTSVHNLNTVVEKQNVNEGSIPTEEANNNAHDFGEQEEAEPSVTPQPTKARKEEAETDNTAQFNQLGDVADSHFYAYFMTMVVICIIGYLVFHNKQKILALALEGRSRRGTRRRPNTSAYRKLDSNLEEAVTSTGSTSVTHVIY